MVDAISGSIRSGCSDASMDSTRCRSKASCPHQNEVLGTRPRVLAWQALLLAAERSHPRLAAASNPLEIAAIADRWVPSGDMPLDGGTPHKTEDENENQRPPPSVKYFLLANEGPLYRYRNRLGSLVMFAAIREPRRGVADARFNRPTASPPEQPEQLRQPSDVRRDPPRLILREVLHIDPPEAGGRRGASRVMARRDTCRDVSRIAAQGEVARIAGHRDLTRSRGQQGSPPLEPNNLAHKMRG